MGPSPSCSPESVRQGLKIPGQVGMPLLLDFFWKKMGWGRGILYCNRVSHSEIIALSEKCKVSVKLVFTLVQS